MRTDNSLNGGDIDHSADTATITANEVTELPSADAVDFAGPIDATHDDLEALVDDELADATAGPEITVEDDPRQAWKRERGERPPILPAWLKNRATFLSAVRWWVGHLGHLALFHGVRIPTVYAARVALRSPLGFARATVAVARVLIDDRSRQERDAITEALRSGGTGAAQLARIGERHQHTVWRRLVLAAVTLFMTLWLLAAWAAAFGRLGMAALTIGIVEAFGLAGRPKGQPLVAWAVSKDNGPPRLTPDFIVEALDSLGLAKISAALRADERAIRFVSPVVRHGNGFRADIDLPAGVTAGDVIERREALASALRRPVGCVWPEPDPDAHEGRLVLYVADRSLSKGKAVRWTLADRGRTDVFEPIPIGIDQRGDPVTLLLIFAAGVIGSIPRMGKTYLLRLLGLSAALDHRCELHVVDLKGSGDLEPLSAVAHFYRAGDEPADINAVMADLRALKADMQRRMRTLRELPAELAPGKKVTPELAARRSLGLHPVFIAIDECQTLFEDPDHGKEAESLVTDLTKKGPAAGIMIWLATQRPDSKSIPTGIRDNAVLRFALKVVGHVANDLVLGTGMFSAGYRATAFGRKDYGLAYLAGDGDDPRIVRVAEVDQVAAEAIAARARAAREATGWLTGMAAGDTATPEADPDATSILDDIAAIVRDGEDRLWHETVAERLAEHNPARYTGWTSRQVSAALKPHGVPIVQIKRGKANKQGLRRDDLLQALADRLLDPEEADDGE